MLASNCFISDFLVGYRVPNNFMIKCKIAEVLQYDR